MRSVIIQGHNSMSNMGSRAKTSVLGSRLPSLHVGEVMESPDESFQSDQEEDLEVSFHPHHNPVPPPNPVGPPSIPTGMYMPYIEGPWMDWKSMMICTIIF